MPVRAAALTGAGVLALGLAVPSPAAAADRVVTVSDAGYSPAHVRLTMGSRVEFTFTDGGHSATSDEGFFDTGVRRAGSLARPWFPSSGTYPYHCTHHASVTGSVAVPLQATAQDGGGWLVRWATDDAPATRTYDVQKRRPGAKAWRDWRSATTDATATFDPQPSGTWRLRARSTLTGTGTSRWSPVRKVNVP